MGSKKYKYGFVLGGGGARGFSHLGAIQALIEKGIKPDVISGVSAGSIVGAFLASGLTPNETLELLKNKGVFNFSKIHFPISGLLSLDGLEKEIDNNIQFKNIEDLPTPFIVAVTNLNDGVIEYKSSGPLGRTVLSSSSIPILFKPVEMNGIQYVDGGVIDNLPIAPIIDDCETIFGFSIMPISKIKRFENLIQIAQRMFQVSISKQAENNKKLCDYVFEPKGLRKFDILDGSKADQLFEIGYNEVKKTEINL
jgi:NTE family protein